MIRLIIRKPAAVLDLIEIYNLLDEINRRTADRILASSEALSRLIAKFPEIGATMQVDNPRMVGLRCLTIQGFKKYLMYYIPTNDTIDIIRVLHGSRDVQSILEWE